MDGANHVIESHEVGSPEDAKDNSAPEGTDESFHRLLWGEFNERCAPYSNSPDVGEDVIADDQECGHPEPYETFQDVVDDEMAKGIIQQRNTIAFENLTSKPRLGEDSCAPSRTCRIVA